MKVQAFVCGQLIRTVNCLKLHMLIRYAAIAFCLLTMAALPILADDDCCSPKGQLSTTKSELTVQSDKVSNAVGDAATTAGVQGALEPLSLNDIQDAGILLNHIKRQAINIYEEASRTPVPLNASPNIPDIKSIPISPGSDRYMPPRREWLMFFLGTMEPVIRDLSKEVTDIQSGAKGLVIPEGVQATLDPLWQAWAADTQKMNHHLDELVPLFEDAPHNNLKIQKVAVAVFDDVQNLEKIRRQVFVAMQKIQKSGSNTKILISPP